MHLLPAHIKLGQADENFVKWKSSSNKGNSSGSLEGTFDQRAQAR